MKTIEQAKNSIFEYIEIWYNRERSHSSLGYKPPFEVEQEFYQFKKGSNDILREAKKLSI